MGDSVLEREAERQRKAGEILSALRLMDRWTGVGRPRLVGAAAYGLMVAPDIDIEIYCPEPRVQVGFSVLGDMAVEPGVWKVRFSNELDGSDQGLYWQIRYRAGDGEVWKIDMWLLGDDHGGPRSADLVEAMRRALTEETRRAILTIKEAVLGRQDVHSIDVYRAVLDDGVRSVGDFLSWHARDASVGLTFWRPH